LASCDAVPLDDHHQPATATAANRMPAIGTQTFAADRVAFADLAASPVPGFGSSAGGSKVASGAASAPRLGASGGMAGALAGTSIVVAGFSAVDAGAASNE
jgi:hypothetical protein